MVLLARVLPLAGALAPAQVLGPVPVLLLEPAAVPGPVPVPVLVQEPGLVTVPLLDRPPGGVPPSLVAALAPLPETAQEVAP